LWPIDCGCPESCWCRDRTKDVTINCAAYESPSSSAELEVQRGLTLTEQHTVFLKVLLTFGKWDLVVAEVPYRPCTAQRHAYTGIELGNGVLGDATDDVFFPGGKARHVPVVTRIVVSEPGRLGGDA